MNGRDKPDFDAKELKPLALTAEQVGQLLGISVRSVWRFSSAGELPGPISIGRSKRWDVRTIEDFLLRKAAEQPLDVDDLSPEARYPVRTTPGNRSRKERRD